MAFACLGAEVAIAQEKYAADETAPKIEDDSQVETIPSGKAVEERLVWNEQAGARYGRRIRRGGSAERLGDVLEVVLTCCAHSAQSAKKSESNN